MTLQQLFISVSALVEERDIIAHGAIRCLETEDAVREIASAEGCSVDDVERYTVGHAGVAEEMGYLSESCDLSDVDAPALAVLLKNLVDAYKGDSVERYTDPHKEDELESLDELIKAAKEFIELAV